MTFKGGKRGQIEGQLAQGGGSAECSQKGKVGASAPRHLAKHQSLVAGALPMDTPEMPKRRLHRKKQDPSSLGLRPADYHTAEARLRLWTTPVPATVTSLATMETLLLGRPLALTQQLRTSGVLSVANATALTQVRADTLDDGSATGRTTLSESVECTRDEASTPGRLGLQPSQAATDTLRLTVTTGGEGLHDRGTLSSTIASSHSPHAGSPSETDRHIQTGHLAAGATSGAVDQTALDGGERGRVPVVTATIGEWSKATDERGQSRIRERFDDLKGAAAKIDSLSNLVTGYQRGEYSPQLIADFALNVMLSTSRHGGDAAGGLMDICAESVQWLTHRNMIEIAHDADPSEPGRKDFEEVTTLAAGCSMVLPTIPAYIHAMVAGGQLCERLAEMLVGQVKTNHLFIEGLPPGLVLNGCMLNSHGLCLAMTEFEQLGSEPPPVCHTGGFGATIWEAVPLAAGMGSQPSSMCFGRYSAPEWAAKFTRGATSLFKRVAADDPTYKPPEWYKDPGDGESDATPPPCVMLPAGSKKSEQAMSAQASTTVACHYSLQRLAHDEDWRSSDANTKMRLIGRALTLTLVQLCASMPYYWPTPWSMRALGTPSFAGIHSFGWFCARRVPVGLLREPAVFYGDSCVKAPRTRPPPHPPPCHRHQPIFDYQPTSIICLARSFTCPRPLASRHPRSLANPLPPTLSLLLRRSVPLQIRGNPTSAKFKRNEGDDTDQCDTAQLDELLKRLVVAALKSEGVRKISGEAILRLQPPPAGAKEKKVHDRETDKCTNALLRLYLRSRQIKWAVTKEEITQLMSDVYEGYLRAAYSPNTLMYNDSSGASWQQNVWSAYVGSGASQTTPPRVASQPTPPPPAPLPTPPAPLTSSSTPLITSQPSPLLVAPSPPPRLPPPEPPDEKRLHSPFLRSHVRTACVRLVRTMSSSRGNGNALRGAIFLHAVPPRAGSRWQEYNLVITCQKIDGSQSASGESGKMMSAVPSEGLPRSWLRDIVHAGAHLLVGSDDVDKLPSAYRSRPATSMAALSLVDMAPHLKKAELQGTIAGGFALVNVKMMSGVAGVGEDAVPLPVAAAAALALTHREQEPGRDAERGRDRERGQRLCEGADQRLLQMRVGIVGRGQGPPRVGKAAPATTITGVHVEPTGHSPGGASSSVSERGEGPAPVRRCTRAVGPASGAEAVVHEALMPQLQQPDALQGVQSPDLPHVEEGTRIRVFWGGMTRWYSGTVGKYDETKRKWHVSYDDGEHHDEPLADPSLHWEVLPPTRRGKRPPAHEDTPGSACTPRKRPRLGGDGEG